MKKQSIYLVVLAVVFALTLESCTNRDNAQKNQTIKQEQPSSLGKPLTGDRDFRNAVIRVAKANIPAVVHIEVIQRQEIEQPSTQFSPFGNDPFLRKFFDIPQTPRKFRRELKGIGTGMIINPEGFILTNYHVVAGATEIQVILSDERQFTAKVIGMDQKTDLAVIKVTAKEKLPSVVFGDSDKVDVGEWVVAIGHPRGLDQTVTQGIVSAKHRQGITDPNTYQDFLQTDAAINPGNSGGPLLNLDGQVIGVNSIIASQSGGFEGIGFAIPSNMAIYIAKALMASGKVERGWIGLTMQDIPYEKMKSLNLTTPKGVYVVDVMKGGPAARGGLKAGDVILSMNGKSISDSGELRNLIASTPIGSMVNFEIQRDGKKLTIPIKIGNPSEAARIMAGALWDKIGADVRPVSEKEMTRYGIEQGLGVVITRLDKKGPLASAGFELDDVIVQVNDQPVDSPEGLAAIFNSIAPRKTVGIVVIDHRSGRVGTIRIQTR